MGHSQETSNLDVSQSEESTGKLEKSCGDWDRKSGGNLSHLSSWSQFHTASLGKKSIVFDPMTKVVHIYHRKYQKLLDKLKIEVDII